MRLPTIVLVGSAVGCGFESTSTNLTAVGTPGGGEPVVVGVEESVAGASGESWTGHSLAFLVDGRIASGRPASDEVGTVDSSEFANDEVRMVDRAGFEGGSLTDGPYLDDQWADASPIPESNGFGWAIAAPGDVTGDDVEDIAVAESPIPGRGTGVWTVFDAVDGELAIKLEGRTSGNAVECGDVDANGVAELCTSGGVYFGPIAPGASPGLSWTLEESVVAASDLDADGLDDLLIGSGTSAVVYAVVGVGADGEVDLATSADWSWTALSGKIVDMTSGDLDDDGLEDVVVAINDGVSSRIVISPPTGGGDLDASATVIEFDAVVVVIGDFDGDGSDDLAAGGGSETVIWNGPLAPGLVQIEDAAVRYVSDQSPDDGFGTALAASDTNGDGAYELAIGAPFHLEPDSNGNLKAKGRVWWFMDAIPD